MQGAVLWRGRLDWREGLPWETIYSWSGDERNGLLMPIQDRILVRQLPVRLNPLALPVFGLHCLEGVTAPVGF